MSLNATILVKVGLFLDEKLGFVDLVCWVQDHEEHWASLPPDSVARFLADTIMLAAYEVDEGVRNPDSLKELLSESSLQPAHG